MQFDLLKTISLANYSQAKLNAIGAGMGIQGAVFSGKILEQTVYAAVANLGVFAIA